MPPGSCKIGMSDVPAPTFPPLQVATATGDEIAIPGTSAAEAMVQVWQAGYATASQALVSNMVDAFQQQMNASRVAREAAEPVAAAAMEAARATASSAEDQTAQAQAADWVEWPAPDDNKDNKRQRGAGKGKGKAKGKAKADPKACTCQDKH